MLHGIYIGYRADLKGKGAILRRCIDGGVVAQFDDLSLSPDLTHAWPKFSSLEFEIDKPVGLTLAIFGENDCDLKLLPPAPRHSKQPFLTKKEIL